jgi:crotonobetainyl-CoA:carnitine CoA-transferase CaiB-like acyl-CoA transferase
MAALTGLRVLDLTRLLPGAFCTLLLADWGADVVKLEEPGAGDYLRWTPPLRDGQSVLFNGINRNKRSLTLNLKNERGRELFKRLAAKADAVVEGNRPRVMDRLGLGWDMLHALNPRLVMCSISGYGQDGPWANRAGHDLNYMATAGALYLNGPAEGPLPLSVQVADIGAGGVGAAAAMLAALLEVARGGEGRHLDVSMTDGALSWLAMALAQMGEEGQPPERVTWRLNGRYACYRTYRCGDGGFYSVAALEPKFWSALCEALGKPDLIPLAFAEGEEGSRVHAEMERAFASRTRAEWEATLEGRDVCAEPVLRLDEVARNPQVAARRLLVETPTGLDAAPGVRLDEDWRRLGPPALGEHTAEVLGEVGVDEGELEQLRAEGVI